jgi:hypothetical protein
MPNCVLFLSLTRQHSPFVEFYDGKVPVKKEPAPPAEVFLADVQRLMIAIAELSMDEMKEICKETNDLMKAIRRKNNFLDAKSKQKKYHDVFYSDVNFRVELIN